MNALTQESLQTSAVLDSYAEKNGWGEVPVTVKHAMAVYRKYLADPRNIAGRGAAAAAQNPMYNTEQLVEVWPGPFQKLRNQWEDRYIEEFPEVMRVPVDRVAGSTMLTNYSKDFRLLPSDYLKQSKGWRITLDTVGGLTNWTVTQSEMHFLHYMIWVIKVTQGCV